ncbi:MAG TPA: hypothetical protein PLP42_13455 [Acidobacteriota bacterium]|nr:hypothetical protein [Acidobacteriota bacterium]
MTAQQRKDPPVPDEEVIGRARYYYEEGTVVRYPHFDTELRAAGATHLDVEFILFRTGRFKKKDYRRGRWRYVISGEDDTGDLLEIVIEFDLKNCTLRLITAY